MCDFFKPTIKLANPGSPAMIYCMTSLIGDIYNDKRSGKGFPFGLSLERMFPRYVIDRDSALKLDFLILVIETLQINAMDSMLATASNIGLADDYSNRVNLWKIRCLNPMRKSFSLGSLSQEQVESLVILISSMSEKLYPLIRQLLSSKEPETLNKERWNLFNIRLKSLINERMNLRRTYIKSLLNEDSNNFFRHLLVILSLSSGKGGISRLKASLYLQN